MAGEAMAFRGCDERLLAGAAPVMDSQAAVAGCASEHRRNSHAHAIIRNDRRPGCWPGLWFRWHISTLIKVKPVSTRPKLESHS
jgi:hypothetical protein